MKLSPARKKILTLCGCFWLFTLTLASFFRIEQHRIASLFQTGSEPTVVYQPEAPQIKPKAHKNIASEQLLKDWQDWQRRPVKWSQQQKEDFFKANCQDVINSGREKLREISSDQY